MNNEDTIKQLIAQRDEARREVCWLKSSGYSNVISAANYAELRKWSCFDNHPKDNNNAERLRMWAACYSKHDPLENDLRSAANEIEALQKELKLSNQENLQHRNNVLDELARMDEELGLR
jgi:arginine deiminase